MHSHNLLLFAILVMLVGVGARGRQFVHITDQHMDPDYHEGTVPEVDWCESRVPGSAGRYGDFKCHSPAAFLDATFSEMHRIIPSPDFILWTGDFRRGYPTQHGRQEVLDVLTNTTEMISRHYPSNITSVLPVLGNHDTEPSGSIDPTTAPEWLYPAIAELWSRWLPESSLATLRKYGSYSYWSGRAPNDWGIIALNTCLWLTSNKYTANMTDPGNQFNFLETELLAASQRGQRAYVIGHCPPSPLEIRPHFLATWVNLMRKYSSAIEAGFYGHDHLDYVRLIYDRSGYRMEGARPVGVSYVSPSGTTRPGGPLWGHNPAFTVFNRVSEDSVEIASRDTYWCDLAKANKDLSVVFQKEYSTDIEQDTVLGMESPLTAEKWDLLLHKSNSNNEALQLLYKRTNVQSISQDTPCNESCKRTILCMARYGADTPLDFALCLLHGL